MKNTKVIFGLEVDAVILALIDYVDLTEIPAILDFLECIREHLVNTLSTFPEGGNPFQGQVRMKVIKKYTFLYEYHVDRNEVHILDMKAPDQNWR